MKRTVVLLLSIVLVSFLIPYIISGVMSMTEESAGDELMGGDAVTAGRFSPLPVLSVYSAAENRVFEIDLEEYIAGVLAGEMPPTYNMEALKAQAVAARSYILSRVAEHMEGKIPPEHNGAMLCTDYKHCKAWRDIADVKAGWDIRFADDYEAKIRNAVSLTKGEYMVYDRKVVKAYFYAISGGRTENVEEVWGSSLPYLKSVVSREDIGCDGFESLSTYPKDLFVQKLKTVYSDAEVADAGNMIGEIQRTEGGSVAKIVIGNHEYEGGKIRELYGLRSANFEISAEGDKIVFRVKGYGHGVGMSQNGANVLASEGKSYVEILKHYYTGVDMVNLYKKR